MITTGVNPMFPNYKCYNLTKSVIDIEIDTIKYNMGAKGSKTLEGALLDSCTVIPAHASHPKFQALLLSNPPRIKFEAPAVLSDSRPQTTHKNSVVTQEIEVLRKEVKDISAAMSKLSTDLTAKFADSDNKISAKMKDVQSDFSNKMDAYAKQLNDTVDHMNKLKETIDLNEKSSDNSKGRTPKNNRNSSPSGDLFSK